MAGNTTALKSALKSIFEDLDPNTTTDQKAQQFTDAIDNYIQSLTVQTNVSTITNTLTVTGPGTIPTPGTGTGTGTGNLI